MSYRNQGCLISDCPTTRLKHSLTEASGTPTIKAVAVGSLTRSISNTRALSQGSIVLLQCQNSLFTRESDEEIFQMHKNTAPNPAAPLAAAQSLLRAARAQNFTARAQFYTVR